MRSSPATATLLGTPIVLPTARTIDARLVGGNLLFGVGWGLAGFCRAPLSSRSAQVRQSVGVRRGDALGMRLQWMKVHGSVRESRGRHHDRRERMMLIFRQLFDPQSSTYSYLIADRRSREAVLIDGVRTGATTQRSSSST
jgi:hypothetical protein